MVKNWAFPHVLGKSQGCPVSLFLFSITEKVLASAPRKCIIDIKREQEEEKYSFANT